MGIELLTENNIESYNNLEISDMANHRVGYNTSDIRELGGALLAIIVWHV